MPPSDLILDLRFVLFPKAALSSFALHMIGTHVLPVRCFGDFSQGMPYPGPFSLFSIWFLSRFTHKSLLDIVWGHVMPIICREASIHKSLQLISDFHHILYDKKTFDGVLRSHLCLEISVIQVSLYSGFVIPHGAICFLSIDEIISQCVIKSSTLCQLRECLKSLRDLILVENLLALSQWQFSHVFFFCIVLGMFF